MSKKREKLEQNILNELNSALEEALKVGEVRGVQPADPDGVWVYVEGIINCCCCAPAGMDRGVIEKQVNKSHPTGLKSKWKISDEKKFGNTPMPAPCPDDPGRRHWLLTC